ncbi:MAG: chorismate synthase [Candidatus Caenarcaniphilales bacterium]|nr:chorismate synthase [Candidatus Caenarcaniphilales bacterium]
MNKLRFLTAGESHGPALSIIVEGMPSGLELLTEDVNRHLARRQAGYGRGARMKIEKDQISFLSGVRHGLTLGSPISMQIVNKDYVNWDLVMNPGEIDAENEENKKKLAEKYLTRVRPGHADFAGAIKYKHDDVRNVLERSSARETTSRVAAGGVALKFLENLGIKVYSQVLQVGSVSLPLTGPESGWGQISEQDFEKIEASEMRCKDAKTTEEMKAEIDRARKQGESLGGIVEVIVTGLPIGVGSHVHWDRRLDGIIAQALMSVHTVKAVGFGMGFEAGVLPGSQVHDEIQLSGQSSIMSNYAHLTNRAGGIEGGMSNGEPIVCRVALKPIPTLARAEADSLKSIDLKTKSNDVAFYERSDVCVVPAGGVVCEAMVALVLADQILDKFGGDSMDELKRNYENYLEYCLQR